MLFLSGKIKCRTVLEKMVKKMFEKKPSRILEFFKLIIMFLMYKF